MTLAERYAKVAVENMIGDDKAWGPDLSAYPDLKRLWEAWQHDRHPTMLIEPREKKT